MVELARDAGAVDVVGALRQGVEPLPQVLGVRRRLAVLDVAFTDAVFAGLASFLAASLDALPPDLTPSGLPRVAGLVGASSFFGVTSLKSAADSLCCFGTG